MFIKTTLEITYSTPIAEKCEHELILSQCVFNNVVKKKIK